jgi:dihydrodipicolinate synthase/N-acetylneuraminate lyase
VTALGDAFARLAPARRVHGIAAVLLPYTAAGAIDWHAFERLVARTCAAGLDLAVNMDTGFGDLLTPGERRAVLDATRRALGSGVRFYAGAFADATDVVASYHAAMAAIDARGGVPVIVQCRAMRALAPADKAALYRRIADGAAAVLAFELGPVFAPHGEIWDEETFARILELPRVIGSKHSSLDRGLELRRLAARDAARPEFRLYTGNDLAIDMIAYGSDYLLGLATYASEAFAARDAALAAGSVDFLAHNDALQHLGNVGFRAPVAAYKHAAALFLHLTGALASDAVHPRAPRRPPSDRILLLDCALRLGMVADPERAYRERVAPYL